MSFIKQTREWFFRGNAPVNPNVEGDLKDNLADRGAPSQSGIWQPLLASIPFFKRSEDRAKQSTGGAIENEVGLTSVAPDADVTSYTSGLKVDRTTVTHPEQLTEIDEVAQTVPLTNDVPEYNDIIVEKNKDVGSTVRNKFIPRLKQSFLDWLTANVLPRLIPSGGDTQEVLCKTDASDYNVEWCPAPGAGGEANDGVTVGTSVASVFKQKTGLDLEFRGIDTADVYTTVAENGDTIEIGTDIAQVLAYIQANIVFPPIAIESNASIGGQFEVYKAEVGTEAEFRTIEADTGVTVVQTANTLQIKTDDAHIQSLIDAAIAASGGEVLGIPYLFHATSSSNQVSLPVSTKVRFLNDYDTGNFDNGNTWSTSQWEANAEAVGESLEFSVELVVETLVAGSFASLSFDLVKEAAGGGKTVIGSAGTSFTSYGAGDAEVLSINNAPTGVIVAGDKVYLEVSAETIEEELRVNSGAVLYNVTA